MDIDDLVLGLKNHHSGRYICEAKNIFLYSQFVECDIALLRKSGFLDEIEVKTSRSDFKADFKKTMSHKYVKEHTMKHDQLEVGAIEPNYFSFMLPKGLIDESEIPSYCGIYTYEYKDSGFCYVRTQRVPPRLHKRKLDQETRFSMAQKMSWRYWNEKASK